MLPGRKYTPEDVLRILLEHKWLVALPFVVCLAGAVAVASRLPQRYKSETLIMLVPQRVSENLVKPTVNEYNMDERLLSISDQIQSRSRLERIIADFDLYKRERARGVIMEDVVLQMRKDIAVAIDGRGKDTFRVAYQSQEATTAYKVTERLASLYIEENLRDKESLAENTNQFLESQLADAKRRLLDQEKKLEAYRKAHAGELPSQLETNQQAVQNAQMQLQAVSESINRARERRLMVERQRVDAENTALPPPPSDTTGNSPDGSASLTTAQQLDIAQAKLSAYKMRYKPDHPDIRALERTIRDLEAKRDKEAGEPPPAKPVSLAEAARQKRLRDLQGELEVVDRQIATGEAEEQQLKRTIQELQAHISAVPTRESELVELTRDYNTLQTTYQSLLSKKEDTNLAANLERRQIGETFKVIDPASLPQRPYNRWQRLQVIAGGAVGGLVIGLGLIGFLEYRDSSFKNEEDVLRTLSLPVLAIVPQMASERERAIARRHRIVVNVTAVLVLLVGSAALVFWKLQA
jgi:polysaccharide chain length determinant protein (PEP-CTERM system associated)